MYVDFSVVVLLVIFMAFPLVLWFAIRMKTKGTMNCGIIERGKPIKFKLLKIKEGEYIEEKKDGEHWLIDDRQVKLMSFPSGWMWDMFPMTLFQQTVPTSLYMRGRGDPLNWEDPSAGSTISSKELGAILDPHWLKALVAGVVEGGGGSKRDRIMLFLAVGASVICMILIFVVMTKLGGMQEAIEGLKTIR